MEETKMCKVCGRELPVERFELIKPKEGKPYRISTCRKCRYEKRAMNKNKLSDNIDMIIHRQYKEIKSERVLNLTMTDIVPIGEDEVFAKLMDYPGYWLSNYGRCIYEKQKKFVLLSGSYDNYHGLRYRVRKNVYSDGKWTTKREVLYATKAVVQEFVVNPDIENNVYIWHQGYDKANNYYKNLYPLNKEQYRIVKNHYNQYGEDSEEFIIKVMYDIKFKPDTWSKKCMEPVMCGIGYRGSNNVDCNSEAYHRRHDMLSRCYNEKFHQ
jgi:hypothetical protein